MVDTAERLAILIEANTKQYASAMTKLEKDTERAMRNSRHAVEGLSERLKVLGEHGRRALGLFGVGLGASDLVGFIKRSFEASEVIEKMSSRLGISAEAFQELTYAAEQSGASQEDIVTAFKGMAKFLGEIDRGSKSARAELSALGISFEDLKNKSPDKVFELLLDRVGRIANPIQRAAVELKLFGKSGQEIDSLARLGADGIEVLRREAESLGLVLSDAAISKGAEGAKLLKTLGGVAAVAGGKIAAEFVPVVKDLVELLTSQGFQDAISGFAADTHNFIASTTHDVENLVSIWHAIKAEFGGLSATDQPFQASNSDAADRLAANAGKFRQRFSDDFANSASGSVTTADILKSRAGPASASYTPPDLEAQNRLDAFNKQIDAVKKRTAALVADTSTMRESVYVQERARVVADLLSDAAENQIRVTDKVRDSIDRQADAYAHAAQMADNAKQFYAALDDLAGQTFDAFDKVVSGAESASDAVKGLLGDLLKAQAKALFLQAFNPAGGAGPLGALLGGFGGFRAGGGDVSAGKVYGVGERGPELFVPRVPGRIVANGRSGGGGVTVINNIDASGADMAAIKRLEGALIQSNKSIEQRSLAALSKYQTERS